MKCGEFIGELFRARDILHIEHLLSDSKAEHEILEDLYTELLDEVDEIAELRLARGPVDIEIPSSESGIDVIDYLEYELIPMVDEMKEMSDMKGFNDIESEVDEIKTAIMKALYKLKNLTGKKDDYDDSDEFGLLYKRANKNGSKRKQLIKKGNKCGGGKLGCGGNMEKGYQKGNASLDINF